MDKVEFFDEESKEYIELYVLEQTHLNGAGAECRCKDICRTVRRRS